MYSFLILFFFSVVSTENAPIVYTRYGVIRGVRSDDGNYNMFMGIPYGMVDEANPFGTSRPYPPFEQIFEADDDSSKCPQIEEFNNTFVGDIDCLRLNIYTPTYINITSRLPVYAYIHGRSFENGFYSRYIYGPKYLVQHDIILVVINYRLGPYGFMCLDIPEVPGNQGLKDQIMAFRWIQSHIIAFGGDPEKVTIGGNSMGAAAVDFHIHRDNNREKLYNQVILESGNRIVFRQSPVKNAPIVIAEYYNFLTDNVYEAIAFLAVLPPRKVIYAVKLMGIPINSLCIEKKFPGVESYTSVEWFEQRPATANMAILIGNSDDEVGAGVSPSVINWILSYKPGFYTNNYKTTNFRNMGNLIDRFYLRGNLYGSDFTKLIADNILYKNYRTMREFVINGAAAVYMYNFTYVGNRNFNLLLHNFTSLKAYHADELGYLFDLGLVREEPVAKDLYMIDKITALWTNFIKYGNPTPEMSELIDVRWKPVTPTSPFYVMNINSNLSLTTSTFDDKIKFWDHFFYKQMYALRSARKYIMLN